MYLIESGNYLGCIASLQASLSLVPPEGLSSGGIIAVEDLESEFKSHFKVCLDDKALVETSRFKRLKSFYYSCQGIFSRQFFSVETAFDNTKFILETFCRKYTFT